jgi:hypothetical protein
MNVEALALKPSLLNENTLDNALVIYFAYREQMPLDECIITYLYSISRYEEYQLMMKKRCKVLQDLLSRVIKNTEEPEGQVFSSMALKEKKQSSAENSRRKILSVIHNMTENPDVCGDIDVATYILNVNSILDNVSHEDSKGNTSHFVIEIILKSLINMSRQSEESMQDVDLKDLFSKIADLYSYFNELSRQYALRLMTILTRQWD